MKFENKDTFEQHNVFGMGEPNTLCKIFYGGLIFKSTHRSTMRTI